VRFTRDGRSAAGAEGGHLKPSPQAPRRPPLADLRGQTGRLRLPVKFGPPPPYGGAQAEHPPTVWRGPGNSRAPWRTTSSLVFDSFLALRNRLLHLFVFYTLPLGAPVP
jgi:hypothetical protein